MKLNWGHYIVIVFSGFVLLILYMVFESYQHNNDLVAEDYYAQELEFQDVIEKRQRANELSENIRWNATPRGMEITYPKNMENIQGTISLMRPSDQTKDLEVTVAASSGTQRIGIDQLSPGKYLVKIDWSADGITYFTEGILFVNP